MTKIKFILLAGVFAFANIYNSVAQTIPDLVLCMPFNGTANDMSGNNHHGTISGAVLTTDRFNNSNSAYLFDGTDDYIEIPNFASIESNDEISVSFWAKANQLKSQIPIILYPDNTSDRLGIAVQYSHNGTSSTFWDYGSIFNSGRLYVLPNPYSSDWNHYVFISSKVNNKMEIYENGVLIASKSGAESIINKNKSLRIGGTSPLFFNGKLDDIAIFNRAITASEVTQLYNNQAGCNPIAPIAGFSSDDIFLCKGSDVTITDTSKNIPTSWSWSFPGATPAASTVKNPSVTFDTSGTYTVSLIVSNSAGTDSITKTIHVVVHDIPVVYAGKDTSICKGSSVQIGDDNISGLTYAWTNSSWLDNSTIANPTATPVATTTYILTATDTAGCYDKDTVVITVSPEINFNLTASHVKCANSGTGEITGSTSGGIGVHTYVWSNNDSTLTTDSLTAGTYTLTVTDALGCTATSSVTITQPPVLTVSGTQQTPASCLNNDGAAGASASGGVAPYMYSWANGNTGASVTGIGQGTNIVVVTDKNNCTATDTVKIDNSVPLNTTSICLLTVDSTSTKNVIIWEKPINQPIDSFRIYRQIGNYVHVGSVSYKDLSVFVDNTYGVDPSVTSYKYKIAILDSCGNESALSAYHRSIHLQTSPATPKGYNLFWNDYEGFSFLQYYVLREEAGSGVWVKIDSVSYGNNTYTDKNPPSNDVRYMIEAVNPTPCVPTIVKRKEQADAIHSVSKINDALLSTAFASARSNASEKNISTSLAATLKPAFDVNVFPNPGSGEFKVSVQNVSFINGCELKLFNALGELVYQKQISGPETFMNIPGFAAGMYQLRIDANGTSVNKKLIIE